MLPSNEPTQESSVFSSGENCHCQAVIETETQKFEPEFDKF